MGKKSRKKKSGIAGRNAALPQLAAHSESCKMPSIDNTTCVICKEDVDMFQWDQSSCVFLYCCGGILCNGCYDKKYEEYLDEASQVENLANLMLSEPSSSSPPDLVKISSFSCPLCGSFRVTSNVEIRSRIRRLADAGYTHAQYTLGNVHGLGTHGFRKDPKVAFKWWEMAAKGGHVGAYARMGMCFYHGNGVGQSFEKARQWYELGLPSNHAVAIFGLGTLYRTGEGVEKDQAKAIELFRQAAEQGLPEGLLEYASALCEDNRYEEALVYYQRGAILEQLLSGHREAVSHCQLYMARTLFRLHMASPGSSSDSFGENDTFPRALFWTRRAAKNGNEQAKETLIKLEGLANDKCRNCGEPNPQNKCTKCRAVWYCDKTCQRIHWKTGGHKAACTSLPVLQSYSKDECAQCGDGMPQYTCERCGKANYCDETCQRAHWYQGGHKDECKFL